MKRFINNIKNKERGAISTLVLFTILMFVVILMGVYLGITTMQKSQLKSDLRIQDIYKSEVDRIDEIYNDIVNEFLNEVVNESTI